MGHQSMMMLSVAFVWTENVRTATQFYFVTCATSPFIKTAMESRISQKGSGFAESVSIHHPEQWNVSCVQIKAVL